MPAERVAEATGLTAEQVQRVYKDIEQKRRTTSYLHARPQLVEAVNEVGSH
jgi:NAD+ synthase